MSSGIIIVLIIIGYFVLKYFFGYVKEIFYYGVYQDAKHKTQYRYKVIFENDRVTEIRQI